MASGSRRRRMGVNAGEDGSMQAGQTEGQGNPGSRSVLMNPLYLLRRRIANMKSLSPALVLNPAEFDLVVYSSGESRVHFMADMFRQVHLQPSFWATNNNERLLLKCVWLCKFYGIEDDPKIVLGDCSAEKSIQFWGRFSNKVIHVLQSFESKKDTLLGTESDWSLTGNDVAYSWSQFISMAFVEVFSYKTPADEVSQEAGTTAPIRKKFLLKDVMALDKLSTMGVLEFENIQKLTNGMGRILEQLGIPDDYIENVNKVRVQEALDKIVSFKDKVDRLLEMWKANDFFQATKTVFMVVHANKVVPLVEGILATQRSIMLDVVHLLDKGEIHGNPNDEPVGRFVDRNWEDDDPSALLE